MSNKEYFKFIKIIKLLESADKNTLIAVKVYINETLENGSRN